MFRGKRQQTWDDTTRVVAAVIMAAGGELKRDFYENPFAEK